MLPYFIDTKEDLEKLIQKIEALEKSSYNLKNDWDQALNEIFTEEEKEYINKTIQQAGGDKEHTLRDLREELEKTKTINITLAWKPTVKQQKKIAKKIKGWVKNAVIKTHYNPDISGGVVLEYKGKYLDLSLKHKYETGI